MTTQNTKKRKSAVVNVLDNGSLKEKIHFGVPERPLHLHVLHDLETDGLEGGQSEQEFREPLGGDRVHVLGACLQRL